MRDLQPLTADRIDALAGSCAPCTFWIDPPGREHTGHGADAAAESTVGSRARLREWITEVTEDWGPPGWLVLPSSASGQRVHADGHVLFAPAKYAAGLAAFSTAPSDPETVMLLTVVLSGTAASGRRLAKALVVAAMKDAQARQARSIDAIGVRRRAATAAGRTPHRCVLDVATLESVGFVVVREHPFCPRLRLDLRRVLALKDEALGLVQRALAHIGPSQVDGARPDATARVNRAGH